MRLRSALPIAVLALASSFRPAEAQSVAHELLPESGYVEGCYPPCLCPLFFADSLTGAFVLTYESTTPDFYERYDVSAVDWTISLGGTAIHVTGSGTYAIGGPLLLQHRLQLDLSFDGAPTAHFDSGLQPGGATFPAIEIAVSENGMVCFDRVFDLHTRPLEVGRSYCSSVPNSTGLAATVGATGSRAVADDFFFLQAEHAVPSQFGIFFFGPGTAQVPFGEGTLCVSGSLRRLLPPIQANAIGGASRAIDFDRPPATGNLVPGSGWNFQYWYRDPAGGPAGFNLTDGLHVQFL